MNKINDHLPKPTRRFEDFGGMRGWKRQQLGEIFKERVEKGHPNKTVLSATQDKGVIPYKLLEKFVIRDNQNLVGYKLVKKGDFVISLRSFEGGFEYSEYEGIISPAYVVLEREKVINDDFFRYFFKTNLFIKEIQSRLNNNLRDGKSISYSQAKSLIVAVPTIEEQKKIAACLASLDEFIAIQSQKLGSLKAHKKGLMQQLFPSSDIDV